ncbi:STAS domain-containing protein [Leptospira sp. GIMC2001]|uniref:STAS domain-containing protein n=1 Tax=Leptospira sp. GIMC2001 TaxID=1513297 RepID=UPI00234AA78C|nr:STAS domain-containing protein [Leptospira sp. GIMC2001]WCL50420.1 STAS domain-containing protein [Leptospira sp. GIMC2001]
MNADLKFDIKIIRFQGAILRRDSEKIEADLVQSEELDGRKVILELTKVHHICSSALGVLVAFKRKLKSQNGDVKLVINDEDILQVFEITMLDKVFEIYSNLDSAIESF